MLILTACGGAGGVDDTSASTTPPAPIAGDDSTVPGETTTPEASTTSVESPPGDAPDPCSLLTAEDIELATGLPFDEGVFNDELSSDSQLICDWIGSAEYATVQTLIVPMDVYDGQMASASGVFALVDVDIDGADDSYATEEGSLVGMRVGALFLQVSYIPPGPGEVLDVTAALATTAVTNLEG
jgi:hypothetical protein